MIGRLKPQGFFQCFRDARRQLYSFRVKSGAPKHLHAFLREAKYIEFRRQMQLLEHRQDFETFPHFD